MTWYARLITFVSFTDVVSGEKRGKLCAHYNFFSDVLSNFASLPSECKGAFISYFVAEKARDQITKCVKLKWEAANRLYAIIDISNIYRIVHVVPFYTGVDVDPNLFLLNRFLFRLDQTRSN